MIPTVVLRFVERPLIEDWDGHRRVSTVRVLQQYWIEPNPNGLIPTPLATEWRDVPLEKESPATSGDA